MQNLMIDIETLGSKPNAVILSISAVEFDLKTGKTGSVFNKNICIDSCIEAGLKMEHNTILWWLNQDKEAQNKITQHTGSNLKNVLRQFGMWIHDNFGNNAIVWGNSARFDLGILDAAYTACKMNLPWKYYSERDVRTLVAFAPEIKENTEFKGIKHYGIDDCKHQIEYCSKIYQTLAQ